MSVDTSNLTTRFIRRLKPGRQTWWLLVAIVVGLLAAGGEIAFRQLVEALQLGGFGVTDETFSHNWDEVPLWIKLCVPIAGGIVVGLLTRFVLPGQRPKAVADVIEASALRDGHITVREMLAGAAVNITALGAGSSVGREGPIVHLGAALASLVSRTLKMRPSGARLMLGCGVAAAVAAAFNAPLAGVFFALEVVLGSYGLRSFAPVVVSSVTATMISRQVYGDRPAFLIALKDWEIGLSTLPSFAMLGLAAAALALAFMVLTFKSEDLMRRIPKLPRWTHPMGAGVLVAVTGIFLPQILGVGYEATDSAIAGDLTLSVLATLLIGKLILSALCLGSGFGAGFFSPTLFLGAMLGGVAGLLYALGLPEGLVATPTAYVIAGMGAVAGAVMGAPISTTLIIFEMTGDYDITIAVLLSTVIATTVLDVTFGQHAFAWQLQRRGINLRGSRTRQLLEHLTVADVMTAEAARLSADAPIASLRVALRDAPFGEVFIVDEDNALKGFVTIPDLTREDELHDSLEEDEDLTAAHFIGGHTQVLLITTSLDAAIELMETEGEAHLPVISDGTTRKLVGVLHERDAMAAYHKALLDAR
ncbi:MAG: chloride channel protein [Alphaproteobacteria bacterium]